MTAERGAIETVTLHAYGQLTWPDLRRVMVGQAAWADYDGFHIGRPPETAPPYTHLWAWSAQWLLRARVDGERAIVAVLQTDREAPSGLTPLESYDVRCIRRQCRTWPGGEQRVGPLAATVTDRPVELWQVDGERPVTFVRPA